MWKTHQILSIVGPFSEQNLEIPSNHGNKLDDHMFNSFKTQLY